MFIILNLLFAGCGYSTVAQVLDEPVTPSMSFSNVVIAASATSTNPPDPIPTEVTFEQETEPDIRIPTLTPIITPTDSAGKVSFSLYYLELPPGSYINRLVVSNTTVLRTDANSVTDLKHTRN